MSVLLISFFALLLIGVPVAAVMGISSMLYLLTRGTDILTIPQRMFAGADSFTLMAIPLYIFAGEIMNRCGITRRIFKFASEIVGFLPGGLALVNVLASTMFGGNFGFNFCRRCFFRRHGDWGDDGGRIQQIIFDSYYMCVSDDWFHYPSVHSNGTLFFYYGDFLW